MPHIILSIISRFGSSHSKDSSTSNWVIVFLVLIILSSDSLYNFFGIQYTRSLALCFSYVNYNFPIGRHEFGYKIPRIKHATEGKIVITSKEKDFMQFFGKIAEEFYPNAPEQISITVEPYSFIILGEPTSSRYKLRRKRDSPPKWREIFDIHDDDATLTRDEFYDGLQKLPFRWPLYINTTVVCSSLYNYLVERNRMEFKALQNTKEIENIVKGISNNNQMNTFFKEARENLKLRGNLVTNFTFHNMKLCNQSRSRFTVHKIIDERPLSRTSVDNILNLIIKDKAKFSSNEFGHMLGSLKGERSNGVIDFEFLYKKYEEISESK